MLEKLKDMICEYVEVDKNAVTENSRFVEDLGFTSYDFMSMVGELEDEFDVVIPTVEIIPDNFNSAQAMYALITRLEEEDGYGD